MVCVTIIQKYGRVYKNLTTTSSKAQLGGCLFQRDYGGTLTPIPHSLQCNPVLTCAVEEVFAIITSFPQVKHPSLCSPTLIRKLYLYVRQPIYYAIKLGAGSFPRRSFPIGISPLGLFPAGHFPARSFPRRFFLLSFSITSFCPPVFFPLIFFSKQGNQPNQVSPSQTKLKP